MKRTCVCFRPLWDALPQTPRLNTTHTYYLGFLRSGVQAQQVWVLCSGCQEASVDVSGTQFPSGTPKPGQCFPCDYRIGAPVFFGAACPRPLSATRHYPRLLPPGPQRLRNVAVWFPGQQELSLTSAPSPGLPYKSSLARASPPSIVSRLMNLAA